MEEGTGDKLSLKLNFTNPLKISQTDDPDFVFVLLNLDQFKDADGNGLGANKLIKVLLPRLVMEGEATDTVESAGASAGSSSKITVIGNFLVNIAMSASLNQLWGMINGLQIMTHMPLCNIKFPANAELFNAFMIEIALFDILPSEWILEQSMYFPQDDSFNLNFQILEYNSPYAIPNLGTLFFASMSFIILLPVLCCICCCAYKHKELRSH